MVLLALLLLTGTAYAEKPIEVDRKVLSEQDYKADPMIHISTGSLSLVTGEGELSMQLELQDIKKSLDRIEEYLKPDPIKVTYSYGN